MRGYRACWVLLRVWVSEVEGVGYVTCWVLLHVWVSEGEGGGVRVWGYATCWVLLHVWVSEGEGGYGGMQHIGYFYMCG